MAGDCRPRGQRLPGRCRLCAGHTPDRATPGGGRHRRHGDRPECGHVRRGHPAVRPAGAQAGQPIRQPAPDASRHRAGHGRDRALPLLDRPARLVRAPLRAGGRSGGALDRQRELAERRGGRRGARPGAGALCHRARPRIRRRAGGDGRDRHGGRAAVSGRGGPDRTRRPAPAAGTARRARAACPAARQRAAPLPDVPRPDAHRLRVGLFRVGGDQSAARSTG